MKTRASISGLLFGLLFALSALCSPCAFAQQETATITGEVRDANGSVVPKATVSVTNAETNVSVRSETNDQGLYTVPSLKPGPYSITVEKSGFKKSVRGGVTLQVNQVARLDVTLQVGDMTTAVEIIEAATLLETETSSRGAVIDQKKIVDLPLNGRDYNQLALLSPGVLAGTPRMASINFKGAINVNGNRLFMNVFLLDGVDNVSYSSSYRGDNVQVVQPSIEALQEFKIQTNAYSAEFGRSAGAVVNATIKSGGNSFHGAAYEFLRNRVLDANNFFANFAGQDKPARQRNQFGGAIGGPIIKDKTFFFTDYEGLRDREGTVRFSTLPLPSQKQGIFTSTVVDPFNNRTPFPNNTIPSNRFDPVGAAIVAVIPDPNLPGSANNYVNVPVTSTRSDQFDVRIDHNYSATLNLFGRYSFVDSHLFRPAPMPGLAEGSFNDAFGTGNSRSQGVAAGATWTINSRMAADLRFGYSRGDYYVYPPNFGIDGAQQVGLKNVPNFPDIVGGLPKFNLQGFSAIGRHTSTPQFQTPRSYDIKASLSDLHGRHFLKYGAEFLFVQTGIRDINALIGSLTFSNGVFTGQALGDLLLGLPQRLALTSNTVLNNSQRLSFFYVQDDFKVTSKLTLNYGLRYEYATPPVERDNQFANFDPTTGTMTFAKDGDLFDRALVHPDHNNFAPRFGFAYSPRLFGWNENSRFVVRGGYGLSHAPLTGMGRNPSPDFAAGTTGYDTFDGRKQFPGTNVAGRLCCNKPVLRSVAPDDFLNAPEDGLVYLPGIFIAGLAVSPNAHVPYVQSFSLSMAYEAPQQTVIEVTYNGSKGTHLFLPPINLTPVPFELTESYLARGINPLDNVPDPLRRTGPGGGVLAFSQGYVGTPYMGFEGLGMMFDSSANSIRHAVTASLSRRHNHGLSYTANYTFGKGLDDASDGGGNRFVDLNVRSTGHVNYGVSRSLDRSVSLFDVKHAFSASWVWDLPVGRGRQFMSKAPG
ncbi:MAG TPA: TonB-dependent receptor, partial [Blastocatellia bacterium]